MSTAPLPTTTTDDEPTDAELVPGIVETGHDNLPADIRQQDAGVLANLHADDEWDGVDPGDMTGDVAFRIPHLSFNAKVGGGIVDPDTGEKLMELTFIWLAKGRSRAWWAQEFGKGDKAPSCRSFDGITADPNSPDLQNAGDCTTCPKAKWTDDGAPACGESIEAMLFLPDPHGLGRLARLRLHGLSIAPARSYWDSFFTVLPKRPPIAFVSKLTLEEVDTDNGPFLRPRFERVSQLSRLEAQPLIDERDKRLADWQADIASDAATRSQESDGAGPFDGDQGTEARTVPADVEAGFEEF